MSDKNSENNTFVNKWGELALFAFGIGSGIAWAGWDRITQDKFFLALCGILGGSLFLSSIVVGLWLRWKVPARKRLGTGAILFSILWLPASFVYFAPPVQGGDLLIATLIGPFNLAAIPLATVFALGCKAGGWMLRNRPEPRG